VTGDVRDLLQPLLASNGVEILGTLIRAQDLSQKRGDGSDGVNTRSFGEASQYHWVKVSRARCERVPISTCNERGWWIAKTNKGGVNVHPGRMESSESSLSVAGRRRLQAGTVTSTMRVRCSKGALCQYHIIICEFE
jgi:hypothetical protein